MVPAYLFEVKTPAESKGPWDYYKLKVDDAGRRGLPPAGRRPLLLHQGIRQTTGETASAQRTTTMIMIFGIPGPAAVRTASARADQRRLLRDAVAGAGGDLRHAQHHQLRARRAVHDGGLRVVDAAELCRHRLFSGADPGAAAGRHLRDHPGENHHQPAVQAGPPVRPAADLRPVAGDRGPVPQRLWQFRHAVPHPGHPAGRDQPRLHVHAELSRLGGAGGAGRLPRHLGDHREDVAGRHAAGGDGECARWCRRSASTCRG